jgi:hypothetical protein
LSNQSGFKYLEELAFLDSPSRKVNFLASDIIVFSSQECCRSILQSFLCNSMTKWRTKIKAFLQHTHELVTDDRLNAFNTMLFIRKDVSKVASGKLISRENTQGVSRGRRLAPEQRIRDNQTHSRKKVLHIRELAFSEWHRKRTEAIRLSGGSDANPLFQSRVQR